MNWIKVQPVIDYSVRRLCVAEYPGHPKGCPNYGKKKGCPPNVPVFDKIYDLSQPVYAIYNRFDIGTHMARMRAKHPDWSERQVRCCLYWQNGARIENDKHIALFLQSHLDYETETCPEAMGVDVTATMERSAIILEWPPRVFAYQIALAAKLKEAGTGAIPTADNL